MRKDFMAVLAAREINEVTTCPFCGRWDQCEHDRTSPLVYNCRTEHWWCHRCLQAFDVGVYESVLNVMPQIERIARHATS